MKTVIIGAGLTGLMLANRLAASRETIVFDKARGVGGRLATRRTTEARFDHGAQFYRPKAPLLELHKRWLDRNLVKLWFNDKDQPHFSALGGMTSLAKDLAHDLRLVLNERVQSLSREGQSWSLQFESGRRESADEVVFTCPAPQTLEILRASEIAYQIQLNDVTYSKALVVLIEKPKSPFQFSDHGYIEPTNSSIFSVADQYEKGTSETSALTMTLNAEFSEAHFDAPEDQTIAHAIAELKKLSPGFEPGETQLKKWRYCQAQDSYGELFAEVTDGLYLAGDAFGGASLNGAARSAASLAQYLLNRN